jgi:hypothetical protein
MREVCMTDPVAGPDYGYLAADQSDRQFALNQATAVFAGGSWPREEDNPGRALLEHASDAYRWLRHRDSLIAVALEITPGIPQNEGTPVATVISLDDTMQVEFTLSGTDSKGASVPLDSGYTAAWALADPDASGAVLTVSADTTSCTVAAGTPTDNLSLSVTVTNPDASVLTGVEAVQVVATAATSVSLVAGTPSDESAPAAG